MDFRLGNFDFYVAKVFSYFQFHKKLIIGFGQNVVAKVFSYFQFYKKLIIGFGHKV